MIYIHLVLLMLDGLGMDTDTANYADQQYFVRQASHPLGRFAFPTSLSIIPHARQAPHQSSSPCVATWFPFEIIELVSSAV